MIILLCGKKGVGKDTVAGFLQELAPFHRMAFTDPMKKFAGAVFGFSDEVLYGPSEKREEKDARYVLPEINIGHSPADEMWRIAESQLEQLGPSFIADLYPGLSKGLTELVMRELRTWMSWLDPENQGLTAREVLQTLGTEFGRDILGEDVWVNYALRHAIDSDTVHTVITDGRFTNEVEKVQAAGGAAVLIYDPTVRPLADAHPSENGLKGADFDWTITSVRGDLDDLRDSVGYLYRDRVRDW